MVTSHVLKRIKERQIEIVILKYAESFEFERKDRIIEMLTLASIWKALKFCPSIFGEQTFRVFSYYIERSIEMKKEEYTVWFEDSWEKCYSFSFQEAAIVACARRIEAGLNTKITSIGCKEYPEILVEACKVILVMLD